MSLSIAVGIAFFICLEAFIVAFLCGSDEGEAVCGCLGILGALVFGGIWIGTWLASLV